MKRFWWVLVLTLVMFLVGCIPRPLPDPPPRSAMVHVIGSKPGREQAQQGAWEGTMKTVADTVKVFLVQDCKLCIVVMALKDIGMFNFSFLTDLARNAADSDINIIRAVHPLEEGEKMKIIIKLEPNGTKTITMEPTDE